jgi:dihydropteroate synthase
VAPLVMGVLNVTPDSFFDGGRYLDLEKAVAHGLDLAAQGADVVDVGGESTRPGAEPVELGEELRRVIPVVEALAGSVRVSIDTSKQEVARRAVAAGATLVNDVSATLSRVAAEVGAGYVVMHMQGTPPDMQARPSYEDVTAEVGAFLAERARAAEAEGVTEVWIDPGIGFGKTVEHNVSLLASLADLADLGWPLLVGTSRKSFLGRLAEGPDGSLRPSGERLEGSIATAAWSMEAGASMVRVHDVRETVALRQLLYAEVGS